MALAFAPVHKLAMGVAFGLVGGLLLCGLVVVDLVLEPEVQAEVLLAQYFHGYERSWTGALIGLGWGFVTGFVFGWFIAFVRNFVATVVIFRMRTKAELSQMSDFLDHI
jgi:hypothetical protein